MANEIALIRKRLKLSQEEFGEALDADQSTVSRWEAKDEVPKRTLMAARLLEASMVSGGSSTQPHVASSPTAFKANS